MTQISTYVAAPPVVVRPPQTRAQTRPQVQPPLNTDIEFTPPTVSSSQFEEVNRRVDKVQQAIKNMVDNSRQVILNSYVVPSRLRLEVFEPTGDLFAKIVHSDTGDLLRTLPPMAMLETRARIDRYLGLLLDEYA